MAKKRRGTSQTLKRALLLLLLGAGICGFLLFGKVPQFLSSSSDEQVLYEVPKNASVAFLAEDLHAKGLILFPTVFKEVVRFSGQEKHIRAGFYYLPSKNSSVGAATAFRADKMATHTVTIPEGKASWEIYGILKEYFPLDSVLFDSLVHDQDFAHSLGLEASGCEGYLFPDTYILPWKISERDAIRSLVKHFQEVTTEMPLESEVVKRFGINGWVTLASIVEKEAAVSDEQDLIAGVFYNRLLQGWSLGADPTTRFALHRLTGPLHTDDLNLNSPYNTRRYTGLPPGPICNPGRGALMAALQPRKTKMMFFVAKDDGSREHYFSASNLEHLAFKAKAAENRLHHEQELDSLNASTTPQDKSQVENDAMDVKSQSRNTKISAAP